MYPAKFDYYRASSVAEAVSLLQQHGPEAKLLAGGHSLIPMMKTRLAQPPVLIDISAVGDLKGVQVNEDGSVRVGAMTTYVEIAANESLRQTHTALVEVCELIGDFQVRNRGTIGGSLAHNDPAADMPAVALALNATVHVAGPNGERRVPMEELNVGLMETSLAPDELIVAVEFPATNGAGSAYEKFENPASGYAVCGVAAVVRINETRGGPEVEDVRVAVTGALDHARRLRATEDMLRGGPRDLHQVNTEEAANLATEGINSWDYMSDIHADGEYRAHLVKVLTRRALDRAVERARGG